MGHRQFQGDPRAYLDKLAAHGQTLRINADGGIGGRRGSDFNTVYTTSLTSVLEYIVFGVWVTATMYGIATVVAIATGQSLMSRWLPLLVHRWLAWVALDLESAVIVAVVTWAVATMIAVMFFAIGGIIRRMERNYLAWTSLVVDGYPDVLERARLIHSIVARVELQPANGYPEVAWLQNVCAGAGFGFDFHAHSEREFSVRCTVHYRTAWSMRTWFRRLVSNVILPLEQIHPIARITVEEA